MLFSGVTFLFCFLPLFLVCYYLVPKRAKNAVLVIGSLFFYAWGEPTYLGVLLGVSLIVFLLGYFIEQKRTDRSIQFVLLVVGLVFLLCVLFTCRLGPLLAKAIQQWVSGVLPVPTIIFPLGMSFYLLSCASYLFDIFWNKAPAQKRLGPYLAYICMFPKLLAGPITPYHDMVNQLTDRTVDQNSLYEGIQMILRGLGKKVLLADNLAPLCNAISSTTDPLPVLTAWMGIAAILFRVYFDFSGYTDIARGMARLLGFWLPRNFRFPFMSRSITEFWDRWHTSLIRWVKLYICEPFQHRYRNRNRKLIATISLFISCCFLVLWHGFGVNIWIIAALYFLLILGERFVWGKILQRCPRFVGRIYTYLVTIIVFVFLFHSNIPDAFDYLGYLIGVKGQPLYTTQTLYYISTYALLIVICIFISSHFLKQRITKVRQFYPRVYRTISSVWYIVLMVLCAAFLVNGPSIPFVCTSI